MHEAGIEHGLIDPVRKTDLIQAIPSPSHALVAHLREERVPNTPAESIVSTREKTGECGEGEQERGGGTSAVVPFENYDPSSGASYQRAWLPSAINGVDSASSRFP